MLKRLLLFWTGPLPKEELYPENGIKNPLLHWLIHPIKRRIAKTYLFFLQRFFGLKVIAIGGSNGKTTTRTFLSLLLPKSISTMDSVTSTYNIPSSILRLRPWTKYFICEMSVEYIGDMDFYLWLARPNIAILTMVDTEHTAYFGSIDNVVREELKLLRGKWPKIVNGNSPLIPYQNYQNVSTFGTSPKFDCFIESAELTPDLKTDISLKIENRKLEITLPAVGKHLAHPVAASILSASILKIDLQSSIVNLQSFAPPPHRLQIVTTQSGTFILDDTYNSNPSSAIAALDTATTLAKLTNRELIIVVSQMNELGPFEVSEHQKLNEAIKKTGAKKVFSIGPAAKNIGQNFSSQDELLTAIKHLSLNSKHLVLFKSSRSWKLEKLISSL